MSTLTYDEAKRIVERSNGARKDFSDDLILCLIWAQSRFKTDLVDTKLKRYGLMQVPESAVDLVNQAQDAGYLVEELTQATVNVRIGTTYLRMLKHQGNASIPVALESFGLSPRAARSVLECSKTFESSEVHPWVHLQTYAKA